MTSTMVLNSTTRHRAASIQHCLGDCGLTDDGSEDGKSSLLPCQPKDALKHNEIAHIALMVKVGGHVAPVPAVGSGRGSRISLLRLSCSTSGTGSAYTGSTGTKPSYPSLGNGESTKTKKCQSCPRLVYYHAAAERGGCGRGDSRRSNTSRHIRCFV